jgi:hypothetical protein
LLENGFVVLENIFKNSVYLYSFAIISLGDSLSFDQFWFSFTQGWFVPNLLKISPAVLDLFIVYCFTSRSRIFHSFGEVTIAGEGLENVSLCSVLRAFEQGENFIAPHPLWHGASVFPVSSKEPPYSDSSYDTQWVAEDLFLPESQYYVILPNLLILYVRELTLRVKIYTLLPYILYMYYWFFFFLCMYVYLLYVVEDNMRINEFNWIVTGSGEVENVTV